MGIVSWELRQVGKGVLHCLDKLRRTCTKAFWSLISPIQLLKLEIFVSYGRLIWIKSIAVPTNHIFKLHLIQLVYRSPYFSSQVNWRLDFKGQTTISLVSFDISGVVRHHQNNFSLREHTQQQNIGAWDLGFDSSGCEGCGHSAH